MSDLQISISSVRPQIERVFQSTQIVKAGMLAIPAFAHLPGYLDLIIIRPAARVKDLHDRSEIIVPGWLL